MTTSNKRTVQDLMKDATVDGDGNVVLSPELKEAIESAGSTYNKDYAERSRWALSILKERHEQEYKTYLEALKTQARSVVSKMKYPVHAVEREVSANNNKGR